jgi:hypothetical protein
MKENTNNLKHTARKLFYALLGWSAVIFLGMLAWFLCNPGVFGADMEADPFPIMIAPLLLLLYILIFSDWLGFDFLGAMGISNLFFIAEGIAIIVSGIISLWIMEMSEADFSMPNYMVMTLIGFSVLILFPQNCLFILLFPILYWLWCDILKKRKYCIYIHKKLRYCLYLLILTSPPLFLYIAFGFSMF